MNKQYSKCKINLVKPSRLQLFVSKKKTFFFKSQTFENKTMESNKTVLDIRFLFILQER